MVIIFILILIFLVILISVCFLIKIFTKPKNKTYQQNMEKDEIAEALKKQTKRDMLASINPNDPQDAKEKIDVIKEIEKLK